MRILQSSIMALFLILFGLNGTIAMADVGRHALIIGIGNYSAASATAPLKGVVKDVENARKMALAMGVDAAAVIELRDSAATKPRILKELARLRSEVKPGDRVLFYWSGHGARFPGTSGCIEGLQTYTDGPFTDLDVMSEAELAAHLQPISQIADKVITVMDACFSGGVIRGMTRSSTSSGVPQAKFNESSGGRCDVGVNQNTTRSLLSELSRLGVRQENFVQIASSNFNEVSWDTEGLGGHATHSLTQCLLGEARDLNGSGAVSLDEIRACAQSRMNRLIEPHRALGMQASTLQVKGNRNLVVVSDIPAAPNVVAAPNGLSPPKVVTAPNAVSAAPAAVVIAPAEAAPIVQDTGPRGTLDDILNQADPRRSLEITAPARLQIGKDPFEFSVRTGTDGYLYAVMLGSDEKSFYLLFPNKLDTDNRVRANQSYSMPRPNWKIKAAGPAGTDRILFVVSASPRDEKVFSTQAGDAAGPFSYSLTDRAARQRLVDFFLGKGAKGRSSGFSARLIQVEEFQ